MAKSTRKKKKKVNTGRLLLSLIVLFLFIGCAFSIKKIVTLHIEKNHLEKTQKELEQKKDDLTAELKNVNAKRIRMVRIRNNGRKAGY